MKILFLADFIPPRHIGGPGKRCFELAQKMRKLGHEIYFVTSCQKKWLEGEEMREGIKIFSLYSNYPIYLRDYLSIYNPLIIGKVKNILAQIRPDIVHIDTIHWHLSYAALRIASRFSKKVFFTARDFMIFKYGKFRQKQKHCGQINYKASWFNNLKSGGKRFNPLRNILIRHYLKYVDKIFAVSHELAKALNQNGVNNTEVIHNALPIPAAEPAHIEPRSKNILLAGRINEAKGVYVLLDALPIIFSKEPTARAILVGAGEDEAVKIKKYIEKKKIKGDIQVIGWIPGEQMESLYREAAVVVSPSLYPDPFPGVNLEAALHKKPVVTTCFGGAKEFVLDGATGYVVNPFNQEELAGKIIELLIDRQKIKQFGEAAFRRLKNDFSLDKQVVKLLTWYQKNEPRI